MGISSVFYLTSCSSTSTDPVATSKIHPDNSQALEVDSQLGKNSYPIAKNKLKSNKKSKKKTSPVRLSLKKGSIADYGATPWYTPDLKMGQSPMKFALDTGTVLLWATTSDCKTTACLAHPRVDTTQSEYEPLSREGYPRSVSFGPWGSMQVNLARIPLYILNTPAGLIDKIDFAASYEYEGNKFQYLAWGGGIGFPSDTSSLYPYQSSLPRDIIVNKAVAEPIFSFYTGQEDSGEFILGGDNSSLYVKESIVTLPPKKSTSTGLDYLWGTELYYAKVGNESIPSLEGGMFYLDTGSSRFKGGQSYILPILSQFEKYVDASGNPIFEKIIEDGKYLGLKYANNKSPNDYPNILPDFSLKIGNSCGQDKTKSLNAVMSPAQYSYKVDIGERQGEWVLAFHILDGVDGLLVGSVFMDLIYSAFEYKVKGEELEQGNMYIYKNAQGSNLSKFNCVDS